MTLVRGIRGAITVPANDAGEIIKATQLLLKKMMEANCLEIDNLAAVLFSSTVDLNRAFPARAARMLGWKHVPLMCQVEIDVPGALPRCIRVLMLVNTELKPEEVRHIYLGEARLLREDLLADGQ